MKRILGLSTQTISKDTGISKASLNSYFRINNEVGRNKMSCENYQTLHQYLRLKVSLIPFEHSEALRDIHYMLQTSS